MIDFNYIYYIFINLVYIILFYFLRDNLIINNIEKIGKTKTRI